MIDIFRKWQRKWMVLSRVLFNNLYHCDKCVTTVNFHKRTDYRSIVPITLLTIYFAKLQQTTPKRIASLNHTKNRPVEVELCAAIFVIWRKYPTNANVYKDTWKTNDLQEIFPQVFSWIQENALPTDIHNKSHSKWIILSKKQSTNFCDSTVMS